MGLRKSYSILVEMTTDHLTQGVPLGDVKIWLGTRQGQ